jgi:hypothetical protein
MIALAVVDKIVDNFLAPVICLGKAGAVGRYAS